MRKCWNWQTGMTKDHVVPDREGSSPFFRIAYSPGIRKDSGAFCVWVGAKHRLHTKESHAGKFSLKNRNAFL